MNSIVKISNLNLANIKVIETNHLTDERGSNDKLFSEADLKANGIEFLPKELLLIHSDKNVLRGEHFQKKYAQSKLISCIKGKLFIAIVNVNPQSQNVGKHCTCILNEENYHLYIPQGYAVGTYALEASDFICMCGGNPFIPEYAGGIRWNDPTINIKWPTGGECELIISKADQKLPTFKNVMEEMRAYEER